jgi:PiT family inorganic phosphate transporter
MGCLIIILLTALLGLYMAWNIGANDVANSMGCAVGSKSISIKWAVIAAGICEFAGSVLVGAHVTDTVRKGIVDPATIASLPGLGPAEAPALLLVGMAAALLAAAVWLNVATWMGMPVSTSHSIVGAVAGYGIIAAGWSAVHWGKMAMIVASWFLSPVVGGLLGYVLFRIISRLILGRERPAPAAIAVTPFIVFFIMAVVTLAIVYRGLKHLTGERVEWLTGNGAFLAAAAVGLLSALAARVLIRRALRGKEDLPLASQLELVERVFAPLVVVMSCSVAFSHGANDVANAVGPLAAIVDIAGSCTVKMQVHVPLWVLVLGGLGIVLGLATFGHRVMRTIGTRITQITPSRGVAAAIAATITVLVCTRLKLPVSTTHTLVGAVLGIGLARGLAAVNRQVTQRIFGSWFITVPAAAILAMLFFLLGRALFLESIRDALSQAAPGVG